MSVLDMFLSQVQNRLLPLGTYTVRFFIIFAQVEWAITALNKFRFALRAGDTNSIFGAINVLP
jgi:hypothetical protein